MFHIFLNPSRRVPTPNRAAFVRPRPSSLRFPKPSNAPSNNLFRPLGWRPPRPIEPYRLIGTILPRSANTPPKAIIQTTTGQKTSIVKISEKLDASTEVVSVEGKQATLSTNGEQHTLYLPRVF